MDNLNKLTLRRANKEDAPLTFEWRNSEVVRQHSFNSDAISWESHHHWFLNSLENASRVLLIAEKNNIPIGVLRFDIEGDETEVGIYLNPLFHGKGLGTLLLQLGSEWIRDNISTVKKIIAKVMPKNIGSHKAFLKSGFKEFYIAYEYKI